MRLWILGIVLMLSVASAATAQTCRGEKTNRLGVSGADIAVSSTAVTIANVSSDRCALMIQNTGADEMRCRDLTNDGAPTTTAGIRIIAGATVRIIDSAAGQWQCIRVTGDTTANVSESVR